MRQGCMDDGLSIPGRHTAVGSNPVDDRKGTRVLFDTKKPFTITIGAPTVREHACFLKMRSVSCPIYCSLQIIIFISS